MLLLDFLLLEDLESKSLIQFVLCSYPALNPSEFNEIFIISYLWSNFTHRTSQDSESTYLDFATASVEDAAKSLAASISSEQFSNFASKAFLLAAAAASLAACS